MNIPDYYEEMGTHLKYGFLALKMIDILENRSINYDGEESTIKSSIDFLRLAQNGYVQVKTGLLQKRPVLASDAYVRAIFAFNQLNKSMSLNFVELIHLMIKNLEMLLKHKKIAPNSRELIARFFDFILNYSLHNLSELTQFKYH